MDAPQDPTPLEVRRIWQALEPYHATVYFTAEARDVFAAAGLRGFWMGYFASRSAPLGPVPAEVVVATFHNFHPAMVRRAIPDAWSFASPQRVLDARVEAADVVLRRHAGDWVETPDASRAAALARRACEDLDIAGRPLAAANTSVPWPDEPHLELWQAVTLLREYRFDGHVAALLTAGVDGCEAHLLLSAGADVPGEMLRAIRGWSEDDWAAAERRLEARGWMRDGALTDAGARARGSVEETTDVLATPPWRRLEAAERDELVRLVREPVRRIIEAGGFIFPNPLGIPRPTA